MLLKHVSLVVMQQKLIALFQANWKRVAPSMCIYNYIICNLAQVGEYCCSLKMLHMFDQLAWCWLSIIYADIIIN